MMPAGRDRLRNQRGFLAIGDGAVADRISLAQENHMILAASNSRNATNSRACYPKDVARRGPIHQHPALQCSLGVIES